MDVNKAAQLYGGKVGDWRQLANGAVAKKGVKIGSRCNVEGPVVLLNGTFFGGTFFGGTFFGGTFRDGLFFGGTFRGGTFRGGTFRGGLFRDGLFFGGTFRDGLFFGGTFHDGTFRGTPLQIHGLLPWHVCASGPIALAIGCENHSLADWRKNLEDIAERRSAKKHVLTIRMVLDLAEKWFSDNPDIIAVDTDDTAIRVAHGAELFNSN